MKRNLITLMAAILVLMLAAMASAQDFGPGQGNGVCQFIDEDGDGFNDLAPDADGDGIPNGMDEDYVRPEDGSGNMYRHGQAGEMGGKEFGFAKGEGMGQGAGSGQGYGLRDGSGSGVGPGDGTGFGPGTGDCQADGEAKAEAAGRRGGRR